MFSELKPNPCYLPGNCENFWVCADANTASAHKHTAAMPHRQSTGRSAKEPAARHRSSSPSPLLGFLPSSPSLSWPRSHSPKGGSNLQPPSSSSTSLPSSPRLWRRAATAITTGGGPSSSSVASLWPSSRSSSPLPSNNPAGISILGRREAYQSRQVRGSANYTNKFNLNCYLTPRVNNYIEGKATEIVFGCYFS